MGKIILILISFKSFKIGPGLAGQFWKSADEERDHGKVEYFITGI